MKSVFANYDLKSEDNLGSMLQYSTSSTAIQSCLQPSLFSPAVWSRSDNLGNGAILPISSRLSSPSVAGLVGAGTLIFPNAFLGSTGCQNLAFCWHMRYDQYIVFVGARYKHVRIHERYGSPYIICS